MTCSDSGMKVTLTVMPDHLFFTQPSPIHVVHYIIPGLHELLILLEFIMPRCACASEVYGSMCACVRGQAATAAQGSMKWQVRVSIGF